MGITHIAGLGKSPGAVTTGISYLLNRFGKRSKLYGETFERLILLTSPQVADGSEKVKECILNDYGTINERKKWPKRMDNAVEIVRRFYEEEAGSGELLLCTVDVNDFSQCFDTVGKLVLKYHPPGETGKHIWANVTGGTNMLNMAIFEVAYLSGSISKLYYTFISDATKYGKYLRPFVRDDSSKFNYKEIFVIKTIFDGKLYQILRILEGFPEGMRDRELWERLRAQYADQFGDWKVFINDYLNVMDGNTIERINGNVVRLTCDGRRILQIIESPIFKALTQRERLTPEKINELTANLKIKKLYG